MYVQKDVKNVISLWVRSKKEEYAGTFAIVSRTIYVKSEKITSWHQFLVDLWVARVLQNRSEDALLPKTRTDNGQAGG